MFARSLFRSLPLLLAGGALLGGCAFGDGMTDEDEEAVRRCPDGG